jgi:hypothetical protein
VVDKKAKECREEDEKDAITTNMEVFFFFCKEGQHSYNDCKVRKTWLASGNEM